MLIALLLCFLVGNGWMLVVVPFLLLPPFLSQCDLMT